MVKIATRSLRKGFKFLFPAETNVQIIEACFEVNALQPAPVFSNFIYLMSYNSSFAF